MDKTNRKIIEQLLINSRMSVKEIAEKIFLSSPSVSLRISQMEENNIIENYTVRFNHKELGYDVHALVFADIPLGKKIELKKILKKYSNIIACNHVSGEYSFIIEVIFETSEILENFVIEIESLGKTQVETIFSSIYNQNT